MPPDPDCPWHALSPDETLRKLGGDRAGLSDGEAADRLRRHGANMLPKGRATHPLLRFLAQFNSALIYFLLVAAVAAMLLGHFVDAAVIVGVVLVNAVVGFIQEGKAERALDAIRDMIAPRATVLRAGSRRTIPVAEIVPGDIVMLAAGDRVPADLRLLHNRGLMMDEAALTGESMPVDKQEEAVAPASELADRRSMAFSGTLVTAGQGLGVVCGTGADTQIGRISAMLEEVETATTPLLRQINRFGRRFTWVVLGGSLALFGFAVTWRGFHWADALIAVVALAVGVVPEGLPAVITITLAIGVQRMAARNAIVRHLPAVETLGATSVICTDKTGTLTRNEMIVRRIVVPGHQVLASGSGYAPEGRLTAEGPYDDAEALAAVTPIIRCGLLCNDATLNRTNGGWSVDGDPMEGALVALAMKAGLDPGHARGEWIRLDEIPFDAGYRFMATLHRGPDNDPILFIKGAPEVLIAMSGVEAPLWEARIAEAAAAGERVLGFAAGRLAAPVQRLDFASLGENIVFLGLMGFIDPPRAEARAAVAECRSAGIAVKMITGDHAATALAIARQLAISDTPETMTGAMLEMLSDQDLIARVNDIDVFARTSPAHKLRIVRALQAHGAIVAMTGDGVNDAPSLKQADVGTAMGRKGTEAAKEAADMVLLDDNFASIVAAVHEGRTVHDNISKVIAWTLPTNGGEAAAVMLAMLLGFSLPMTATQILWINLILAVTLGLALAFEPPEPDIMRRPPRPADAPLLSSFLVWRVFLVSALMATLALGLFFHALGAGRDLATARTMVVNMLAVAEIFYLFNVRYLRMQSLTLRNALGTPAVWTAVITVAVAQIAFTYMPVMNRLFDSRPLRPADGLLILALGTTMMAVLEGEKLMMRHLGRFREAGG